MEMTYWIPLNISVTSKSFTNFFRPSQVSSQPKHLLYKSDTCFNCNAHEVEHQLEVHVINTCNQTY